MYRKGYTGHSFNDFNHVDLTTMRDDSSNNRNDGQVIYLKVTEGHLWGYSMKVYV
jgi:hypothetical protein